MQGDRGLPVFKGRIEEKQRIIPLLFIPLGNNSFAGYHK